MLSHDRFQQEIEPILCLGQAHNRFIVGREDLGEKTPPTNTTPGMTCRSIVTEVGALTALAETIASIAYLSEPSPKRDPLSR